jgi:enterobactin synthetase component D
MPKSAERCLGSRALPSTPVTFAAMFRAWPACTFVERSFEVTACSFQELSRLYPMPEHLHRAVLKRQVEFLAGRVCAQQAIEALTGHKPATIPAQADRAPGWPRGIIGGITHTTRYAAALVSSNGQYQGIGLDCERLMSPEQLDLQTHICTPRELDALHATHRDWPPERLLTLVFSAKESLYKCLYPQVRKFFGFSAARLIALDPAHETFVMQLEQDLTPRLTRHSCWSGRFSCQSNLLMTAIVDPSRPR